MSAADAAWATLLGGLLLAACAHDLRARRIPNGLVLATLGAGLAHAAAAAPAPGLAVALLGVLAGLATWLPLYALGMLGAGDVKLFAAAAAWLGPHGVLPATLYAALAGGALALVWVMHSRLAPATAGRGPARRRDARLPYGLAVAAGVLTVAWGATP